MECWNIGKMDLLESEWASGLIIKKIISGMMTQYSSIPTFHHSSIRLAISKRVMK
jgi:hypothetical protein